MPDAPTPDELTPRYKTPDPGHFPEGRMTVEDVANYQRSLLELGRKKNAKTEVFGEVYRRFDAIDYYLFCRLFSNNRFAEPGLALGVGSALRDNALARSMLTKDKIETLRDEGNGSLAAGMEERDVHHGTNTSMKFTTLYKKLLLVANATTEAAMEVEIGDWAEKLRHPFVWLQMLGDGPSFYVYGDNILEGVSEYDAGVTFDQLRERADMLGDEPLAVWDYLSDDREFTLELEPHQMLGEMKAKAEYDASNIDELNERDWMAQTKYDGARLFVHHTGDGDYRAYLAGGRDVTAELPELYENRVFGELPDHSFILDAEATPYDAETGGVLPFQHVLKRAGREGAVDLENEDVVVRFKFFDALYWKGHDIRHRPYEDRLGLVKDTFLPPRVAQTGGDLESVFERSLAEGHEGVVLKKRDHTYEMDTRSSNWQKWKAEPMEVDAEVRAVYEGSGRAAESVGALGLRLRGPDDMAVDVGRVGTGFSDADRGRLWDRHQIEGLHGETVQVSFEELQYNEDDGWALRFPAFDAMRPEGETDSLERVACEVADMEDEWEEWLSSVRPA